MKKFSIYFILAVLSVTACQKNEITPSVEREDEVKLFCAFGRQRANLSQTKADYNGILTPTTELTDALDISVIRIDQAFDAKIASKPDSALNFNRSIPNSDQDNNAAAYKYKTEPQYYYTNAQINANPTERDGAYHRISRFGENQYFKGTDDMVRYVGWCPRGTVTDGNNTTPFAVKQTLNLKTDVMYSNVAVETMNAGYKDTLVFKHALSQFRIFVYRMQEIGLNGEALNTNSWGSLKDITIENDPNELTCYLPDQIVYSESNVSDKSLAAQGFPSTDGGNVFFLGGQELRVGYENRHKVACFLAAPPKDGLLSLAMTTEKPAPGGIETITSSKTITIANDFKAGYAYDIILCFSDHGIINCEASLGKWLFNNTDGETLDVAAQMYYDLSRYGTANSYVVASSNVGYTFKGNVKGCGNNLNGGSLVGVDDCSLPEDSYIDILYSSEPGLITLANHSLIDGNVTFTVPGKASEDPDVIDMSLKTKGNVIIAAYDTKGGNILWSWHIWLTDRPKEQGYGNGYSFMDRNLGALDAPTDGTLTDAFYYQWGRKDPIIPGWSEYNTTSVDAATATKNVKAFYGVGTQSWSTAELTSQWGLAENQDMTKTIYDPCPPGYRVSELSAWLKKFNGAGFIDSTHDSDGYHYVVNGTDIWYPSTGYIAAPETPGTTGTVSVSGTLSNVYSAQSVTAFDAVNATQQIHAPADACQVRCVSVEADKLVTNLSKTQTANCYIVPSAGDYKFRADIRGNGANKVSVGGSPISVLDVDATISHSKISFYTVIWWQGDLSNPQTNDAGTDCPIKFVNTGKRLPSSPGRSASGDFTDEDITVIDQDGFIQFKIDEASYCHGNAIIAAFDGNNNILWSWHIWLTDEPENIKFGPTTITDTDGENNSYTNTHTYFSMDRNLGATYSPSSVKELTADQVLGSFGLYYQWGRKDPFPGPTAPNKQDAAYASSTWWKRNVDGNFAWRQNASIEHNDPLAAREDAIKSPTVFYECSFTRGWSVLQQHTGLKYVNWHTTDWEAQGVERSKYISMWGCSSDTPASAYNPRMSKTINDPCPPGYYIPSHYLFAAAGLGTSGMESSITRAGQGTAITSSVATESREYGVFINPNSQRSGFMWMPYAGFRSGMSGQSFNNADFAAAGLLATILQWFGFDQRSRLAAQYHSGMDHNAFSKASNWTKTTVRDFCVRPNPNGDTGHDINAIYAGQLDNFPSDATPIRCRAY